MKSIGLSIAGSLLFLISNSFAKSLSLENFLAEVRQNDPSFQAAEMQQQSSKTQVEAAELPTKIQLFSSYSILDDERPVQNPSVQGKNTQNQSLALGLKQQTELGLQWALSQNVSKTTIVGAQPNFIPTPDYYDVFPKLELSVNLWRNFLGDQTTAEKEALTKKLTAAQLESEIRYLSKVIEAEQVYWQAASSQELLRISRENEGRAEKLYKWSSQRRAKGLSDASDLFQADAAFKARKLETLVGEARLMEAGRRLNLLRGKVEENVSEEMPYERVELKNLKLDAKEAKVRKDILIQRTGAEARAADARANIEKLKPTLDLSAQMSVIGRDPEFPEAQRNQHSSKNDFYQVGVVLTIPLDYGLNRRLMDAQRVDAQAATLNLKKLELDGQNSYQFTVSQLEQIRKQLELLRDLERIQRNKADEERRRYNLGRSTTYQVLTFEQDYVNIIAKRLELELQARGLLASLRLFE